MKERGKQKSERGKRKGERERGRGKGRKRAKVEVVYAPIVFHPALLLSHFSHLDLFDCIASSLLVPFTLRFTLKAKMYQRINKN
jgi:hypothetical protein